MYKTNTHVLHERTELIQTGVNASTENYTFFEYQNKPTDLPVVRLDITMPIYRVASYRTRTAQLKYIHGHGKPADFFSSGQENESTQQAQHELLVVFAKQGRAASISPIMSELETEEQREPLLITLGGLTVNGNRRLAAMRELFVERPNDFRHFSHVDCAVLPENVTPAEMREIEIRLQMRPETKLPYEWIVESIAIQELVDSGKNPAYIADLMKKKKKDVERAAQALTEANIYLKEWLREPGEYQYVEEAEQFFNDLAKALSGKQGSALEASRRIAWALLSNAKNLRRRVYDYNFSFTKRTDEVVSALADRLNIDLTTQTDDDDSIADDLDIDLDDDDSEVSLEPLIEAFDDISQRQTVIQELINVCDTIMERDKQGDIGRRALNAVQAANSKLHEVDLTKADVNTYQSIETQLDSAIGRATDLKKKLKSYKSSRHS